MLSKIKLARPFSWWYTPLKWGVPLIIALSVGGIAALLITNVIAMPAILSAFKIVPTIYQGLGSLGKIAFLGFSAGSASVLSGFLSAMLVRVGLFQHVETLANDNLNNQQMLGEFLHAYEEKRKKKKQKNSSKLSNYQNALLEAEEENRLLRDKIQYLKACLEQNTNELDISLGPSPLLVNSNTVSAENVSKNAYEELLCSPNDYKDREKGVVVESLSDSTDNNESFRNPNSPF